MRYVQAQPDALLTLADVKQHLRVDGTAEDAYITSLILAATAHAETVMECSLITRQITATYSAGEMLSLPRGPVSAISSVTSNGVTINPSSYVVQSAGTTDYLRLNGGNVASLSTPLVVTYLAGYGFTALDVPADIVQVVKCMVGLLYESREVATDRTYTPVPFISEFYKLHSRGVGVG